jgi:hypothetical protein
MRFSVRHAFERAKQFPEIVLLDYWSACAFKKQRQQVQ